jgi:hypothetical protein
MYKITFPNFLKFAEFDRQHKKNIFFRDFAILTLETTMHIRKHFKNDFALKWRQQDDKNNNKTTKMMGLCGCAADAQPKNCTFV